MTPLNAFYAKRTADLKKFKPFYQINLVFPHIGRNIVSKWGTKELPDYIRHLFLDTRGNTRTGFPVKAIEDLTAIDHLHEDLFSEFLECDCNFMSNKDTWGEDRFVP